MSTLKAIILGIVQGLTEFLPVSSSGHIELGNVLLNVQSSDHLAFNIIVHAATVFSTVVVFRKDIAYLLSEALTPRWNDSKTYISKIILSMVPVGVVGLFWKDQVEAAFAGNVLLVGSMLLITGVLLFSTRFLRTKDGSVGWWKALFIGVAQCFAVIPGISRSGSTIVTALWLKVDQKEAARFSFLMVLLPILGITGIKILEMQEAAQPSVKVFPLLMGFLAAFLSGYVACRWMLVLVRTMKLYYFAFYCFILGGTAIATHFLA